MKSGPLGMAGEKLHGKIPKDGITKLWNWYISIKESPLIMKSAALQTNQMIYKFSQAQPPDFMAA